LQQGNSELRSGVSSKTRFVQAKQMYEYTTQ